MDNEGAMFIKNIQELISLLGNDFEKYKSILDQINVEVVKDQKHIDAYIGFINNQLSKAETRRKGLTLLRYFLPLCTNDMLEEQAATFLNNALKNCKNETKINDEAYKVIKPLLEICYSSPDLNRTVTSGTLSKIIENITKIDINSNNLISALKCLDTCLRFYPGSCVPFRTSIENFILSFVDCRTPNVVVFAGRCFLSLQQIGGGGTRGINHKEAWKSQHLNLVATIHSLMDELFELVLELNFATQEDVIPILLPKLPTGDKNELTLRRFVNLTIFLQEMLLGAFLVAKSIFPNVILNLITRGLSITKDTFGEQIINDALDMSSNLYVVQKQLLELLQALMISLGADLIPHTTQICKLITNNLKLTKTKDVTKVKALSDLRIEAYKTFSLWTTIAKRASCTGTSVDALISAILNDITPETTKLNLTVQNVTPKNLSKTAKRKLQQEQITQSGIAKNYSPINKKAISPNNEYQKAICLEGLNILQTILTNCGYQLSPAIHKELQEFVVKTLFNIQRGKTPTPYDDINCKMGLYKILRTLVSACHWNVSPPTEYAIQLFSSGLSDSNTDIAYICNIALNDLQNLIHPPFATLFLDSEGWRVKLNSKRKEKSPSPDFRIVDWDQETEILENTSDKGPNTSDDGPNKPENTSGEGSSKPTNTSDVGSNKSQLISQDISEIQSVDGDENNREQSEKNTKNDDKNKKEENEKNAKKDSENADKKKATNEIINLVEIEEINNSIVLDDDMECLIIEDEPEVIETTEIIQKTATDSQNEKNKSVNIEQINLEEEDMLSSFVNIIND